MLAGHAGVQEAVAALSNGRLAAYFTPRGPSPAIAELRRYPFAFLSGVNTLFNALLHTSGFDSVDFSHLKITLGGGMAVQEVVARRWQAVTGNPLVLPASGGTPPSG